jgi:uncharacterized protein involved in exopolysaccharide biosynthesis
MSSTLHDILHILFKRKAVIGLAMLGILVPVAIASLSRPTLYRAAARLTVTQARVYPLLSPKDEQRNVPVNDTQVIGATVENIQSRSFLRDAAEVLAERLDHGTSDHAPPPQPLAEWWATKLTTALEVVPHTNAPFIDVAYRATAPDLAAAVVNTVAERYVYYQGQVMFDNPTLRAFYDQQRDAAERELTESDNALAAFQEKANIFSLDEQKLQLARAHTQALEALDLNAGRIRQADAESKALTARLKDMPAQLTLYTFGEDPKVAALNAKLVGLQLDLNGLRQLYTDEDRRVQSNLEQIAEAKQMLTVEAAVAEKTPTMERLEVNVAYQSILERSLRAEAEAEAFRAEREELEHNVELASFRLRDLNRLGFEFERMKSVRDAKKSSFDLVLTRLEQARTSEAMDQAGLTNVQIVDHAAVPDKPLPNNRLLTLAIGFVGAMVVGAGGAFGLESLYTTVHGRRDGEMRLGIPVLAVVAQASV